MALERLCRFIWFISAAVYIIRQPLNWSVITSVLRSVCECVGWFQGESVCPICLCCSIRNVPQPTKYTTPMVKKKLPFKV